MIAASTTILFAGQAAMLSTDPPLNPIGHSLNQFGLLNGLRDEVITTGSHTLCHIFELVARSQKKNDRHTLELRAAAQSSADFQSIDSRHLDVEQEDTRLDPRRQIQAFLAARRANECKPGLLDVRADNSQIDRNVIDAHDNFAAIFVE
jgi:hypothetical protein